MGQIDYEALNVTPPVKNTGAVKCIAVLAVTTTSQSQDLTALFGSLGTGHYLTLAADMPANAGKTVYYAFGCNAGTIDETATGTGVTVCYPIPDGQEKPYRLITGKDIGTGIATLTQYTTLHYKGSATGFLRIYRSSVGALQDTTQFPAPGWSR